ncbi:hypothetical protein ACIBKX_09800 [Streptomyces sp. NPDC050658]|uniref:hypothetical protein n=1 Tax=unclassified Streptomyces TaxID=2593676 RepID=UPI00344AD1E5
MPRARARRSALFAAVIAVALVIVQFFAHGLNETASAQESRTAPAAAPYAQCGDDTHPEETSERFRARGRPTCRDLSPAAVARPDAGAATCPVATTRAYHPVVRPDDGTRPARGGELPALLQVFRC